MASPSVWSSNFDELERDMEAILRDQNNLEKSSPFDLDYNLDDLNMYRSGSAPPTVEGSRAAFGGFFENPNPNPSTTLEADDEDSMRTNPAYLSYYYTNENINPRLPPPRVSREDWRASQRFHSSNSGPSIGGSPVYGGPGAQRYGGIGERVRKVEFEDRVNNNNNNNRGDVNNSSLFAQQPGVGLTDAGVIASRRKSFADALQDKDSLTLNTPLTGYTLTGSELLQPDTQLPSSPTLSRVRSLGTSSSLSGPGLGPSPSLSGPGLGPSPSLSGPGRSLTPDPLLIRRTPSPLPPVGIRMNNNNNNNISNINNNNNNMNDINERDLSDRFKGLGYGNNKEDDLFRRGANGSGIGYTGADLDPLDYASQMLSLKRNQVGTSSYHGQLADPVYGQYPQTPTESSLNAMNLLPEYQKAYLSALIAQQKLQQYSTGSSSSNNINTGLNLNSNLNLSPNLNLNRGLYGNSMGYMNSPLPGSGSFINSIASRTRANERMTRVASMRTYGSDSISSNINNNTGFLSEGFANLSLLEDFKSNKTKSFELSDIIGHVVEFSSDQYGSRFIQQKLETATLDEKNGIFPEIFPHARALMTDVFGNYVIQKFFEYGTETQRRQLANQLKGHVLQLTLQMYGCRVIQKALEVVDFDQQTEMVQELNGAIMRCVRDQNGNHVIQKCIECVPQQSIQFIISSFYGHVVELSTHPYGCRVIQRVLEHCDDDETQSIMMEEIMPHVMTLAQDQYGNYVIQHVLQHGKPEERSVIIKKLAGQIVKMSQQKFASNVVEKCLTFGSAAERQILIDEILGTTDENEPLQVMMKDQFANYVVQKVLETCDEANRELILSRIKVHLNALKRYTYGKHIVARVEKLIAAGERVSASSS